MRSTCVKPTQAMFGAPGNCSLIVRQGMRNLKPFIDPYAAS